MIYRKLFAVFAAFIFILTFGLGTAAPAQAQDLGWSTPVEMGQGWFPDIAADASGRVHLAWSSSMVVKPEVLPGGPTPSPDAPAQGYDQVMYAFTDDGSTWSSVNDIQALFESNGGSEVTRPALYADPHGILHMAFRSVFVQYANAPILSAWQGSSWSAPYQMSVDQVSYFSRLAMDSTGVLHLIYTENVRSQSCAICYHIYYRQSSDNGQSWSLKTDISTLHTGSAKPQLLIDGKDNLYVIWEAGDGGAYGQLTDPTTVMFSASYDHGAHWTKPYEFAVPGGQAKNPSIGMDADGNLVAAYLALPDDLMYYQTSSNLGRSWSRPATIPGVIGEWTVYPSRLDTTSMDVDKAGNLHLVLVGRTATTQTTLSVMHLVWNGLGWSKPDSITTLTGDVPEWPRIAISSGNILNVTWFVRDFAHIWNSDKGNYHVWYARGSADAPTAKTVVWPTATPTVIVTPTPAAPTATPTPLDPSILKTPVNEQVAKKIYTDIYSAADMAIAILPALAVIALVLAFVRMRRNL